MKVIKGYPRSTATAQACEIEQAGKLPMRRTHGGAPTVRAWRTKVNWFKPVRMRKREEQALTDARKHTHDFIPSGKHNPITGGAYMKCRSCEFEPS